MDEPITDQGRTSAPSQNIIELRNKRINRIQESVFERQALRQTKDDTPKFYLNERGLPQVKPDSQGFFSTVGDKLKSQALDVFVGDPDLLDIALFDFATTAAGFSNTNDLEKFSLYQVKDDFLYNFKEDTYGSKEDIEPGNILDFVSPLKLQTLTEAGVDPEIVKQLSLEDGEQYLKRELLRARLHQEIEFNTDNMLERYGSAALSFGSQLVDPSLIIAPGVGIAGRKLGQAALRTVAKKQSKNWAIRAAAGTASRMKNNASVAGSLIDNKFTRSHAAAFIGVDAAAVSVGFDLYTQSKENETYERYFGETEGMWWSPERSLVSGTIGLFLGYGISKVLGVENAHLEGQKRIKETLDLVAPDLPKAQKDEIRNIWESGISSLRSNVDENGNVINKEAYTQVVQDMYESLLPLYDNAENLIDGEKPSEILRGMIEDALDSQTALVRAPTDDEINELNDELFRLGDVGDSLHEQAASLRSDISEINRGIELGNADSRFYLKDELKYLKNKLSQVEEQIVINDDASTAVINATKDLNNRQQLANKAIKSGVTPEQVHANAANVILEFMMDRPTFKELRDFLSPEGKAFRRAPSERRVVLKSIEKRRSKLQKQLDKLTVNGVVDPDNVRTTAEVDQVHNVIQVEEALQSLNRLEDIEYSRQIHPEVQTTKYRKALDLKQKASQAWRAAEDLSDPVKRQHLFQNIDNMLKEANTLLDQVRTETIHRVGVTQTQQDRLAREFDADLLGTKITSVNDQSRENARRILEAHYIETGNPKPRIRNKNATRFVYNSYFNKISGMTTSRPDMEEMIQESAEMLTAIELLASPTHVTKSHQNKKEFTASINAVRDRYDRKMTRLVLSPLEQLKRENTRSLNPLRWSKRQGINPNDFNEKLIKTYLVATGAEKTNDPLIQSLADGMKKVLQDVETDARRVGKLANTDSNYIHTQMIRNLDSNPAGKEALVRGYMEHLRKQYDPSRKNGVVALFGLSEAQIIGASKKGWKLSGARVIGENALKYVNPMTRKEVEVTDLGAVFSDLEITRLLSVDNLKKVEVKVGEDYKNALELYLENLEAATRKEAKRAVDNKNRADLDATRSSGSKEFQDISTKRRGDVTKQRRIPQSVLLSREVLETGIVELNPLLNLRHYWSSFGYEVAEQKQVQELLGENGVGFEDFLDYALSKHKAQRKAANKRPFNESKYRNLREMVMKTRDQLAGRHLSTNEESGFTTGILQFINQLTSIPVNARVALLMPGTELVMPALLHVMTSKQKVQSLTSMLKSFKESFNRADRHAFGKTLMDVQLSQRVLVDSGLYGDEVALSYWDRLLAPWKRTYHAAVNGGEAATYRGNNSFSNTAISLSESLSETTRSLSGELVWTRMGQTMFAKYHARMISNNLDRMVKASTLLAGLPENITTKQLAGIARKSGLHLTDMQDYIQNGVITKSGLELHFLKLLREAGADDFGDIDNVYKIINSSFTGARRTAVLEQWERVVDTISSKIDRDVTLPGIFDRPTHAANPIVAMVSRYLSFARGFRAGKMQDLANAGIATATVGMTAYLATEVFNRSLISMWTYGESYEDLKEKWDENPEQMVIYSLSSIPVFGGANSIVASFVESLVTGHAPDVAMSPSLEIFNGQMKSIYKVLTEDDPSDEDIRRFMMNIPILNHALTQAILNAYQHEEDGAPLLGP